MMKDKIYNQGNVSTFFRLPLPSEKLRPLIAAIVRHNHAMVEKLLLNKNYVADFRDDLSLNEYQSLAPKYGTLFNKPAQLALQLAHTSETSSTNHAQEERFKIASLLISKLDNPNEINELKAFAQNIDREQQGTGAAALVDLGLNQNQFQGNPFSPINT